MNYKKIIVLLLFLLLFGILIFNKNEKIEFKKIPERDNFQREMNYFDKKLTINEKMNVSVISDKTIYLTFDDGPSYLTNDILDILKEENVPATFFLVGKQIDKHIDVIKREYMENHTVAIHSFTHDYSNIYASLPNYFNDLNQIRDKIGSIIYERPRIIRLPGGSSNTVSRKYNVGIMTQITDALNDKFYYYYDWNIDSMDASGRVSSEEIYQNVVSHLKTGTNIVLMHDTDTKATTVEALRKIIKYGKDNGYTFAKITIDTPLVHHHINN